MLAKWRDPLHILEMTDAVRPTRYSNVAKFLHWTIAILILGLFVGGKFMTHLPLDTQMRFIIYQVHKSIGFIILGLSLYRLYWRLSHPVPALPEGMTKLEQRIAPITHWLFYGFMILVPLAGWLYVSAIPEDSGHYFDTKIFFVIPVFHWPLPKADWLADAFDNAHGALATAMIALVVLHVAAGLKHHYVNRDNTLLRMLFIKEGDRGVKAVPAITAGLSLVAITYLVVMTLWGSDEVLDADALGESAIVNLDADLATGPHDWVINPEASYVELTGTAFGAAKTARISEVQAAISLDLENPAATGRIEALLGMASIDAGDSIANSELLGSGWFDVANHPGVTFLAEEITGGDGAYDAIGTLTIKEIAVPLTLPFTVSVTDGVAVGEAELLLNSPDYGLGGSSVADEVTVRLYIEAIPAE